MKHEQAAAAASSIPRSYPRKWQILYICLIVGLTTVAMSYLVSVAKSIDNWHREESSSLGSRQSLPTAIIVGVRKCGTRALLEFLNLHPAIEVARKEVHFFDKDSNYRLGVAWYRDQMPFAFPHQVTLEKSPAYFVTESVPLRIYSMNSQVRLIIILRNPITRAISDYTQIGSYHNAMNASYSSFTSKALHNGRVRTSYKAVHVSTYHLHMANWIKLFPRRQIHIVDGDRLITDPVSEVQKVERFLGLDQYISPEHLYFNSSRGFYCMRHAMFTHGDSCLSSSKGRPHPSISPSVILKLKHYFRPHNRILFKMIGQTFDWDVS